MIVDYDPFAKSFSRSRKNMSWPEVEYFFSVLKSRGYILDVWCWNGRLLEQYEAYFHSKPEQYLWIDISQWLVEEAQKLHSEGDFLVGNMEYINELLETKIFQNIFCIASFHHLDSIKKRTEVLQQFYNILEVWWKVYMTNWALDSDLNREKYKKSKILDSQNEFASCDYNIKIGKFIRFYHSFHSDELHHLANLVGFQILENRLFENNKNIITILQK